MNVLEKNLRISVVSNGFPVDSETFVVNHIVKLLEHGCTVEILVDYKNITEGSSVEDLVHQYGLMSRVVPCAVFPEQYSKRVIKTFMHALNQRAVTALLKTLSYRKYGRQGVNLRLYRSLTRFMSGFSPHLTHAHFGFNGLYSVIAREVGLFDSPIVTTFHGYDAHDSYHDASLRDIYKPLFDKGDLFLVNGSFLKKKLIDLGCYEDKVKVLKFGVDVEKFKPNYSNKCVSRDSILKLVSIARLIPLKTLEMGVLVVHYLRKLGIKVKYDVYGDGPCMDQLIAFSKEKLVSDCVTFHGRVSQSYLADKLKEYHLYLMTSTKDESDRQETQGVVTAEAQASGLPVICFDFGGVAETIEDQISGYIVRPRCKSGSIDKNYLATQAANKIANIMQGDGVLLKMSHYARHNAVKNFNDKTQAEKLEKIYSDVLRMYVGNI